MTGFRKLTAEQTATLMSCFCGIRGLRGPINEKCLVPAYQRLKETAREIATIEKLCRIADVDIEACVNRFKPDTMDVVSAWTPQCSDALEELTRKKVAAYKSLGNDQLRGSSAMGSRPSSEASSLRPPSLRDIPIDLY
ncbi:ATP-dependent RNA helicase mtr4 [Mortierella sp. NVP41]|nr:ATP-dependent RNA helicase mtr4 [Mortierella sp. NVP41]